MWYSYEVSDTVAHLGHIDPFSDSEDILFKCCDMLSRVNTLLSCIELFSFSDFALGFFKKLKVSLHNQANRWLIQPRPQRIFSLQEKGEKEVFKITLGTTLWLISLDCSISFWWLQLIGVNKCFVSLAKQFSNMLAC